MSDATSRTRSLVALAPEERALLKAELRKVEIETEKELIHLRRLQREEENEAVKHSTVRHLWINDAIQGSNGDIWIHALQTWERRDPGQPITVDINSPGGSITDGLALYDQMMRMRRNGTKIDTRATGLVASMAVILLQAGEERLMDERAKLLIHEGSATLQGNFSVGEQEDFRTFSTMLQADLLAILAERSTLTERQIATRWKRKDWYLGAQEALKLGFVDRIE